MKDIEALLTSAQKLDDEALVAIFDHFGRAVYKYVLRLYYDPVVATDIVGDVFALLTEQFAQVDAEIDQKVYASYGLTEEEIKEAEK